MAAQEEVIYSFRRFLRESTAKTLVFYVEIDDLWDDDYHFEVALRLLPFAQQTKVIQKKFLKDAKTALSNQLLQRFISCLCLNTTDQANLLFSSNEYGKPYLVDSQFSFSMSNQQGYTSMVISLDNNEVGIDLASCSDVDKFSDEYLEHFKNIFHREEYKVLESVDGFQRKLLFTEYWALKESYTKKLGVGLNGDLTSYNFQNVPILNQCQSFSNTTTTKGQLEIRQVKWESTTKLSVNNKPVGIDTHLALINSDLVVSVCGDIPKKPELVKVPLQYMVHFFS